MPDRKASISGFLRYGPEITEKDVKKIEFDFAVFEEFYPRQEYINNKNQFAFRYSAF